MFSPMIDIEPTAQEINKILKEAQNGNKIYLQTVFVKYPKYHWSRIYHKATGDTILHYAARLGHIDIIKYLFSNFAPVAVDCRNKDDKTALHETCQFSKFESCEILLRYGAEVDALKKADWTPLMLACTKLKGENTSIIQLLLEHGALVNFKNKDGWTCVHLIARHGNESVMKLLLPYGLDTKVKTKNGRSALHIAALHGKLRIVEMLLQGGLEVNYKDLSGNTSLHEATLGGHIDICKLLINNGAIVDVKNSCGLNVIHLSAGMGNAEVLMFFLNEHKFNLNDPDNNGFTGLHYASRAGKEAVYNLLVSCGASEQNEDNFGRRALEVSTYYIPT